MHTPVQRPFAGTTKVKPVWILLKQETVSGSGISWAIRKSAHLVFQELVLKDQRPVYRLFLVKFIEY